MAGGAPSRAENLFFDAERGLLKGFLRAGQYQMPLKMCKGGERYQGDG
jgi:hypothetical protein